MRRSENVVVIDANGAVAPRGWPGMSKSEARATRKLAEQYVRDRRKELAIERAEQRKGQMIYRLRRHVWPWYAAAVALGLATVLWIADAATGGRITGYLAAGTAAIGYGLTGLVATFARTAFGAWRRRVIRSAIFAAGWLTAAVMFGPSFEMIAALAFLTVALAAGWWRAIRIGYPGERKPVAPPSTDTVISRWSRYIGSSGGPLPDSLLTDHELTKAGETYTVNLAPGRQTLSSALAALDRISSGLDVPVRNLVLESHSSESPSKLRLTVVTRSPIAETVLFEGPDVEEGVVRLGPYADGDGSAPWRLWTPGDAAHEGSWWGGLVIGGMGIGKSRKLELISISAMATGYTVVWFIDPQGGASSPALRNHADWYTDLDGSTGMLGAIERIVDWRGKENAANGWIGFDPSSQRPGLIVMIDEAHEVFARNTERWTTLGRKARKVGVGLVAFSQYPGLSTFAGSEPLRAAIMAGNSAVMYADSRQNGQLMPGLQVDPLTLPKLPGYSYTVASRGWGRTAPFRDRYVKDPAAWMGRYPQPALDKLAVRAASEIYANRHERAAADREALEAELAGMVGGHSKSASATAGGTLAVPDFPTLKAVASGIGSDDRASSAEPLNAARLGLSQAQARVWDALGAEEVRYAELLEATGWSKSRLTTVLRDMVDAGHLTKETHGRYRRTDGP